MSRSSTRGVSIQKVTSWPLGQVPLEVRPTSSRTRACVFEGPGHWRRTLSGRRQKDGPAGQATRPTDPSSRSTGSPSSAHARIPPDRFCTSMPAACKAAAALAERAPDRHTVTTRLPGGTSPRRRLPSGTCTAPGACPASHSSASRTSSRTAPLAWRADAACGSTSATRSCSLTAWTFQVVRRRSWCSGTARRRAGNPHVARSRRPC